MATDARARLEITADDQTKGAWAAALRTAKSGAGKIGNEIRGIFTGFAAGVSIQGLQKLVTEALDYGDAVGKAAVSSGLSTNAISELGFAAKGADVQLSDLSSALRKMQVNTSKAAEGSKGLRDSFAELGVKFDLFRKADADTQFEALADAINRVEDESDKARLATEIFGQAGAKLLPLFSQGAEGIRKAREEARRLGLSLDQDAQEKLEAAGDALSEMKDAASGLGRELAIVLAPGIKSAADDLKNIAGLANEATTEIGKLYKAIQDNEKAKGAFEFLKIALNPAGKIRSLILKAATDALSRDKLELGPLDLDPLALPDFQNPLLEKPRKPLKDGEFTDAELAEFIGRGGSAARRRSQGDTETIRTRSQDAAFAASIERYENERQVLDDLDRSIAETSERIFEENEQAIAGYLDSIEQESLETFEVTTSVFEELGETIEGSLADAFYNAGDSARDFGDTVLDTFKRILADRAAKEIVGLAGGLFGGLFSTKKDPGVGAVTSGGLPSLISGALLGGFGGFKAKGGPLDQGKWYMSGEDGPEPIWGGGPGAFAVGYGQQMAMSKGAGSSMSVSVSNTIVMQPGMNQAAFAKQVSDQTVARIKDEQKRGKLRL